MKLPRLVFANPIEPTVLRLGWSISDSFPGSADTEESGKEDTQFQKFHKIDIVCLKYFKK